MKIFYTTFILSAFVILTLQAQNTETPKRKCLSPTFNSKYEEAFQQMLSKHQQFANQKKTSTVYTIPIVFHVLHSGVAVNSPSATSGRNLNAAQINSQLTILNEDYRKLNSNFSTYVTQSGFTSIAADVEINFCMAQVDPSGNAMAEPGIDRINVSSKGWTSLPYTMSYIESTVKPNSIWDPTKYFNVWILEFGGSDIGTLGYAQFPTVAASLTPISDMAGYGGTANTDGVVIDYHYIGNTGTATGSAPYNKGRTLVHEAGHWLGLWHIWGDDGSSCSGTDNVTDTPNQADENYTCPSTNGAVVTDACTSSSPGVNYQNYMDYSDDRCMAMFTAGQKARMQAVMANCIRRNSLASSNVCNAVGIKENTMDIQAEIYPNPAKDELHIDYSLTSSQDINVSIINTLGQTLKELIIEKTTNGNLRIDISSIPSGVYFISIKTISSSKVNRLVIE